MDSLSPNRHEKVGSTGALDVLMPEPWSGVPVLTFRRGGVDIASAGFAVKRAADTCTAISGTVITGTFGASPGLQGPVGGLAFLVTVQDGIFPVQIAAMTTTTVTMAEPLPRVVTISALLSASLVWRWWSAPIPAAVTASETGTTPADWRVEYTASDGSGFGTRANQRFGGLIHVTAERFSTGVGSEKLRYFFGDLPRHAPGDQSFAGPLEMARMELVQYVRFRLTESASGRREDDIIGTDEGFQLAHARLAAAEIFRTEKRSAESIEELRRQAFESADRALATVSWYDPTGSGEGENGTPAARPTTLVSGSRLPARSATASNPFGYQLGRERG